MGKDRQGIQRISIMIVDKSIGALFGQHEEAVSEMVARCFQRVRRALYRFGVAFKGFGFRFR